MSKYGILLVSHVSEVVDGISRLITQVAADVPITVAGGTEDNDVGTSLEKINQAIIENEGEELLVFYDLGSAKMNLEMAEEFSEKPLHIFNTAFIESAYSAAALLQVGVPLAKIEKELEPLIIK
ncbi:PTS-dependent dihydroxyacetone kinase phosphotransferase subunit DhaM [Companilactobacillus sp. RD055328]|uniref:dihydroxyacetone kinase phosphoryl donor subunit DhaM n=1 Tax=Companilactobacillus sp. RD055328 TaxID=2916634 RepID=UPI001FC89528|nr:dihydroxyacetone kinase phosphoryl donor subunit DhaM [Companilactobacillus sp. RD055328]GKQ42354.1 PTS-dependent dihydroxyacetone kinase phosphotransferase subunit DhaM [Companilactobacillus sp. RD055328]